MVVMYSRFFSVVLLVFDDGGMVGYVWQSDDDDDGSCDCEGVVK